LPAWFRTSFDAAADEAELEDVYDTERQLLYVAFSLVAIRRPKGRA
jgi:hypothetical protein